MGQKFNNDARAILGADAAFGDTSIVLASDGDLFPVANMGTGTTGDWFKVTLEKESGEREIVKVRTRASGSNVLSNLLRGQEGTDALNCTAGETVVGLRLTAGDVQEVLAVDWSMIPPVGVSLVGGLKQLTYACRGKQVDTDDLNIMIPANTFSKGDIVVLYNNTLAPRGIYYQAGVFLVWSGGVLGPRLLDPYGLCSLFCIGPNIFRITGDGVV
jgi:hypothetical protein